MANLVFATMETEIEIPFFSALASTKIDHDKLDVSARQVLGTYEIPRVAQKDKCQMVLNGASLGSSVPKKAGLMRAEGMIRNLNTMKDLKEYEYNNLIKQAGRQIWESIRDGTIYSAPSFLATFTLITFADLKKYHFSTFTGYPALHTDPKFKYVDPENPVQRLTGEESTLLCEAVNTFQLSRDERHRGFFLAKKLHGVCPDGMDKEDYEHKFLWMIGELKDFESGFFNGIEEKDQYVGFADPSTFPTTPGWMLRNLLVLVQQRYKLRKVQIICYRETHERRHEARSLVLNLEQDGRTKNTPKEGDLNAYSGNEDPLPKITGWERTDGKLKPKTTDMSQYMDPLHLADQSVDLNLKLMKWRISPNLNLEKIKNTKCLLIGAGTLGSYVSRNLMGWGVRKITFIDNGTVSFSNPVRQPLFNYEDCLNGGAPKAIRAAEALKQIYPGVDATGYNMTVPMLGHALLDEKKTKANFEQLRKLIRTHDVICLLMDTRESRWLPTLMGKAEGKIVMNAALGFDSYVAMRHGISPLGGGQAELGCYFCNDVVAPLDSIKDLTLDQQCTVTRPGIAAIASAQLVELLVSILQHPDGGLAGAPKPIYREGSREPTYERDPPDHPLGLVPHQIRGYLASWSNMLISGKSYDCCSACSPVIVDTFKNDGWAFIKKALTEKDYITELSGLAEVQRKAEEASKDIDWSSEDDVREEGEGELL